ncbi:MAG: c-type cytochrome [Neisseriaceae bacterium]|nr:c-type cytochrome [Neisseriaceae bacterium]
MTSPTKKSGFFVSVFAGLIIGMTSIYLIVSLVNSSFFVAEDKSSTEATAARIKPQGEVMVGSAPGSRTGEEIYNKVCFSCHAAGLLGSPVFSDKAAWAARIAKGFSVLTQNATKGINQMPARGNKADLTDEEMARVVAYMANKAGANFKVIESDKPVIASESLAAVGAGMRTGEEIYNKTCVACHATGVLGSPVFGDKAAWAARLTKGLTVLTANATKGINQMPPKGNQPDLSDEEMKRVVVYMANKAGANFSISEKK